MFIPASAADAAAVNPNGIKISPFFNNGPRSLPRNPPDCYILDNWGFDNLIPAEELFVKALQRFATYLIVNNNSCGILVLSLELPIIFDDNLKTTSALFFILSYFFYDLISDFNLLSCEFDSFILKLLYWVILYW